MYLRGKCYENEGTKKVHHRQVKWTQYGKLTSFLYPYFTNERG